MKRVVAMSVTLLCLAGRWWAAAPAPVAATNVPFQTVQFNICSRYCTDNLEVSGASNTNYGLNPIAELSHAMTVRGLPLVISLNEVCSPALFSLTRMLAESGYAVSFVVVKHVGGTCGEYGNVVAVRTLGDVHPRGRSFQFWYGHTGPPPAGSSEEWRGGVCSHAAHLEPYGGCSSHLVAHGRQADGYRAGVDAWFPGQRRVALGDFNQTPDAADMQQWRSDYSDATARSTITHEPRSVRIDYAWFGGPTGGPLGGRLPPDTVQASSSDHHLLFATAD